MEDQVTKLNAEQMSNSWHNQDYETHSLHTLAPYTGSFPPELARYFIEKYSNKGETVYDPFAGSGTTPLVSVMNGRKAYSSDSFIYSEVLSKSKLNPIERSDFADYVSSILSDSKELDDQEFADPSDQQPDLDVFYSDKTLEDLGRIREVIERRPDSDMKTFFDSIMCGILHGSATHHISVQTKDLFPMGTNYVEDYIERNNLVKPEKDIEDCIMKKYDLVMRDGYPSNMETGTFKNSYSRDVPYKENSVDLVLTSPPYLHLVNYSWNNWIRLWWLRADYERQKDRITTTASLSKYKKFIRNTLTEISRVMKSDGKMVVVAGNVKKNRQNKTIKTYSVISKIATDLDFEVDTIIWDNYGESNKTTYNIFNKEKLDTKEANDSLDACVVIKKK